jgi:hypothetical protein
LSGCCHDVIVAHARNVSLIGERRKKADRMAARTLARLEKIDHQLLSPVKHRSAKAQGLTLIGSNDDVAILNHVPLTAFP